MLPVTERDEWTVTPSQCSAPESGQHRVPSPSPLLLPEPASKQYRLAPEPPASLRDSAALPA